MSTEVPRTSGMSGTSAPSAPAARTSSARDRLARELRAAPLTYPDTPAVERAVAEFAHELRAEGVSPERLVPTLRAFLRAAQGRDADATLTDRLVSVGIAAYFDRRAR